MTLTASLPNAPFPYDGEIGDSKEPFFAGVDPVRGERMHTVLEGVSYPEHPHYVDNRVLIHMPPGFNYKKPFEILVFFHGHDTELRRTLVDEMALLQQVNASGRNVVLIAPQLVLNAMDSSPGKLYRSEGFKRMLTDVGHLLRHHAGKKFANQFAKAPVILAAFSGGYRALAYTLDRGFTNPWELDARLRGVILLDGLYGEVDKYASWLQRPKRLGFFVNLHTISTREISMLMEQGWQESGQSWSAKLSGQIKPRQIYSLYVNTPHKKIPVEGPPAWPLADLMKRIKKR
ncbi:MAG: hypothetical protein H7839_20380 [Magnetococcus sp. YQC-5]